MSPQLADGVVGRAHRATEVLHSMIYFAPEAEEELTRVGLRPGRMCYFASRSAPMGPVPAAVTAATFYNFNSQLIARHIPRAWTLASPGEVQAARLCGADRALRRLLGEQVSAAEVAEAAELVRLAASELEPAGRALYAGHAELDWPDQPHLVMWHGATLLREYRGDGHVAALLQCGLSGIEAIVTHTATGRGFTEAAAKGLRGWSDDQWAAAQDDLRARGLFDGADLSPSGVRLREQIEAATDRMDEAPYLKLGPDRTDRLIELGRALSRIVRANGAFPPELFAGTR
jgi:hypothetical protein